MNTINRKDGDCLSHVPLTDLHCHILPGIDDGARNESEARGLLLRQQAQGVRQIAFTPHFDCESQSLSDFLKKREQAAKQLVKLVQGTGYRFCAKLGAEVYYSVRIAQLPVERLCFTHTPYLLLELPTAFQPMGIAEVIYALRLRGIIPLFAHIERYPYLMESPERIREWVIAGALMQSNAGTFLHNGNRRKQMVKLVENELVHVVSSDAHSLDKRPPKMQEGLESLRKLTDEATVKRLLQNANRIFYGQALS